jgi:hypothetical protein
MLLCAFALAFPLLERSPALASLAKGLAALAAALMSAAGLTATSRGAVLATARGAFVVTPECILTPLLPVYLAVAAALTRSWRARALALAAAPALFGLLALARLCVLAVPAAVAASPLVLIHGFHQLVLGAALVLVAAWRAADSAAPRRRRVAAGLVGALAAAAAAPLLRGAIEAAALVLTPWAPHALTRLSAPGDAQGALAVLPAYQAGLFAGLWLARFGPGHGRRLAAGLGILGLGQVTLLVVLGESAAHAPVAVPATLLRAWAVLAPLAVLAVLSPRAPVTRAAEPDPLPA